jgi:hypothetical protein
MLDHMQLTEILAASKRRELEQSIRHHRLLEDLEMPEAGVHPRQFVAGALVRLAMLIDAGAGRAAAAAR